MRPLVLLFALVLAASGCLIQPQQAAPPSTVALPPRLDSYFEQYCDYTGGLGIHPSHTYDYRFRQHLKETHDPEMKRLFVLKHLQRDVEFELGNFEHGIVRTGKVSVRPLTLSEWEDTQKKIQAQIDDLTTFYAFTNFATTNRSLFFPDPELDSMEIEGLRRKLRSITNFPATSQGATNRRWNNSLAAPLSDCCPAESSNGSDNFSATLAADRAFPAAVTELRR